MRLLYKLILYNTKSQNCCYIRLGREVWGIEVVEREVNVEITE
ncbi:MAG: hypothetical protein WBA93_10365 [Microcoleaceae cyanobacterium]